MPAPVPGPHKDPIPAKDADCALFAAQFGAAWVPATFNVVLPLAATITAAAGTFTTKLAAATDGSTRGPFTIAEKNAARAAVVLLLRNAIRSAQAAYLAGTATEAALNNLGVRANSLIRTVIGTPMFAPILGAATATSGVQRLRIQQVDPTTGAPISYRKFAYGITNVEVQRKVGAADWAANQTSKRVNIEDSTAGNAIGTVLQYRVRYQNAKGDAGHWSNVVTTAAV